MATIKITKKNIEAIPLTDKGQKLYWDTELSGFGICIGKKSRSYIVQRDIKGKPVRYTIGKHGVWQPDPARKEAHRLLLDMAHGINPNDVKKQDRIQGRTLLDVHQAYIQDAQGRLAAGTKTNYQDFIDNHYPDWHKKSLDEINRDMIVKRHELLSQKAGRSSANASLQYVRALYNYAMIDNNDLTNPVTVLSQRKLWHKVERRTSYIRDTQVAAWYSAVLNLKNQSIKDGLRFLLFTGLRRMEAFTLRWEHVDFDKRLITIPHTKNGSSHELPLSDYLYDLLHRRKQDAGNSPWVFPGDGKAGHLTEPRAAIKKIVKESKVEFMPHDLRRTFITIAEQLNISAYSLKRLLNHKKGNDVTAGYIIIETERLRKPMQDISDKLISLLHTTQQ